MEKCTAYLFSLKEVEEALQNCLDDRGLKLREEMFFYSAESGSRFIDGSQVDKYMAQILGVEKCEHYATERGIVVIVDKE